MSILMTEYDYATDLAVQREEAYEDGLFAGLVTGREEGISIGLERGLEQGAYQNKLETAKNFLSYGDSPEKVATCTGLPLETVEQLASETSNYPQNQPSSRQRRVPTQQ